MRWVALLVACACASCVVAPRPLVAPPNDQTTIVLLTGVLGPPLNDIARHPWLAVRLKDETTWHVYEVGGGGDEEDPITSHSPYEELILHKVWRGNDEAAECVMREGPIVTEEIESHYIFYPGPNSNTFGDVVLRRCKLGASLPSTSVGKDWRGVFGAGLTSERTGVQIETPVIGLKIGLKEGIEVHFLGLSIGIDFWPPAIIVPLGPGRIGFADR